MKGSLRNLTIAGALSITGAAAANFCTPKQAAAESSKEYSKLADLAESKNQNLEIASAEKTIFTALESAGIPKEEILEAQSNPEKPISQDWWKIIVTFLALGGGLAIDAALLTVLMERLKTNGEKMKWLGAIGGLHVALPQISGVGLNMILSPGTLNFTAAALFVALIHKMHQEKKEEIPESTTQEPQEIQTTTFGRIKNAITSSFSGHIGLATAVSIDSAASGPTVVQLSDNLNTTPMTGNLIIGGTVLTATAIAIGLQKHKDKFLSLISEDQADAYGKGLAVGVFSAFLLKCFSEGMNSSWGTNLTPTEINTAIGGLSIFSGYLSVTYSTRQKLNAENIVGLRIEG